jgi:dTDP-4-dehydrorhamnose reductase
MEREPLIIITGAEGQLAQALLNQQFDTEALFFSKKEFDLTDYDQMEIVFIKYNPTLIINTAAYTKVDDAESNQEKARTVNTEGVGFLSILCSLYDCKLIHISTDYVFDGEKQSHYTEEDKTNPVTVYGSTKLIGEKLIMTTGLPVFAIIRTSWLYSQYGHNFYKTMLRLAETKSELQVVDDQTGCPTNANDLAEALVKIASQLNNENSGIYHFSNAGATTWYGFAQAIFKKHNTDINIIPVTSEQFPTAAKRPRYSVLDHSKIKAVFDLEIEDWKTSLNKL